MAATTPRGFHAPERSDPVEPNVTPGTEAPTDPTDVAILAAQVDGLYLAGLNASRPAAGVTGRVYYSTDTRQMSLDIGSGWRWINEAGFEIGTKAQRLATVKTRGQRWHESDTGDAYFTDGVTWFEDDSRSRAIADAGPVTASATAGVCGLGAVEIHGGVTWTLSTHSGYANSRMSTDTAGRYRITANVDIVSGGNVSFYLNRLGSVTRVVDSRDINAGTVTLTVIEQLDAGDGFMVNYGSSSPAEAQVRYLVAERLGW
jgi:hypothetical protein